MHWQFTPYTAPLIVGFFAMLLVLAVTWRRRGSDGADSLLLLVVCILLYIGGYIMELGSSQLSTARFWIKIEYIGVAPIPVFLVMLVLAYTGFNHYRRYASYLLVISAITLILAWTNEVHEWIWSDMRLEAVDGFYLMDFTPGGWYWVNSIYTWICFALTVGLLLRGLASASGALRNQIAVLLLAALVPLLVYLIYLTGIVPLNLDLNPYALSITGLLLALGLFYFRFLDLMPVARQRVLMSLPNAVIVLDSANRIVFLNPVAETLVGHQNYHVIGQPAENIFAPWHDMQETYGSIEELQVEIVLNGQVYEMRITPLYGQDRATGRMILLHDITARKRIEQELKETNDRMTVLRQIDAELSQRLDVNYVATFALDAALRMSRADAAFVGLMVEGGIRVVQAVGRYPDILPVDQGIIGRVVQTLESERVLDVNRDPDYYPGVSGIRSKIVVPLVSSGDLVGVLNLETRQPERFTAVVFELIRLLAMRVAVAIDNAHAYQERDTLVNELETFAHTVAHDLKNPLSNIMGFSTLSLEAYDDLDRDIHLDNLDTIRRSAEKGIEIINSLLLLAGIRARESVEIEPVLMGELVEQVIGRLRYMMDERDVTIQQPESWPEALGYAPWVEEIWANYISNAIKYGGDPPQIILGYDQPVPDCVRFWVQDNGAGLTEEQQTRLFQPFSRIGQSKAEGHGLGLSIVQRIADKLNGRVGVESAPGAGSRFYFTLPADGTTHIS
jgi:PAS domain S-box-containing protein